MAPKAPEPEPEPAEEEPAEPETGEGSFVFADRSTYSACARTFIPPERFPMSLSEFRSRARSGRMDDERGGRH